MSDTTIDLRGNTNFVVIKDLNNEIVVPRTNLAAVDMTAANGLTVVGNTLYANLATAEDISLGTTGHLVDAVQLKAALDTKQASFTVGDLLENTSGTLNRKRYMPIIQEANIPTRSVQPVGATAAVSALVLEPGNAYKITATNTNKWLATTAAFKAEQDTWGLEGHIELFIAGTGYVHTDDNVVLSTPLEPDAVNNCTIRFHDGKAIISVEDTIAGYIVLVAGGTEGTADGGSLYYGLSQNVGTYIGFNDVLSGTVIDMAGVTTYNGEKHVVGNGYSDTVLTGGISCTNKTTVANLSLQNVTVAGGTLTLGDAFIPSGSTVAVSGGGLAVEKVTGAGSESVIDLGGTNINISRGGSAYASGATFSAGSTTSNGGAVYVDSSGSGNFVNCQFLGNNAPLADGSGGGLYVGTSANVTLGGCIFSGNVAYRGQDVSVNGGNVTASNCTFYDTNWLRGGEMTVVGGTLTRTYIQNTGNLVLSDGVTVGVVASAGSNPGTVTLASGAILDLTGNTNPTPIAPGGGIVFESGGATVYPSAGSASAAFITGGTFASISNDNVFQLSTISAGVNTAPRRIIVNTDDVFSATNVKITSGYGSGTGGAANGGAVWVNGGTAVLSGCSVYNNKSDNAGGGIFVGGKCYLTNCFVSGNTAETGAEIYIGTAGELHIGGQTNTIRRVEGGGSTIISGGASITTEAGLSATKGITVLTGGCTVNGNAIPAGTYTKIDSNGQPT